MTPSSIDAVANPRLFYRLDPGEPGLLRSARASDSVRRVTQQEQRNIRRLENQARREGRQVLLSRITYRYGIDGSYQTIRSGKTEVVSRDIPDQGIDPPAAADEEINNPNGHLLNPDDAQTVDEPGANPALAQLTDHALAERKQTLELEHDRLERELDQSGAASGPTALELREVEDEIADIEREKTRRSLVSQQDTTNAALQASQDLAGGFIGLVLGGNRNIEDIYNGLTGNSLVGQFDIIA